MALKDFGTGELVKELNRRGTKLFVILETPKRTYTDHEDPEPRPQAVVWGDPTKVTKYCKMRKGKYISDVDYESFELEVF